MTTRFEDLPWPDARPRYAAAWKTLLRRSGMDPSLLPNWIECAADAAGRLDQLRVFLAFDGGELIGVLPYFQGRRRMAGIPLKSLELAGNLVAYHQEVVSNGRQLEVLAGLLGHRGWDILLLDNAPAEGLTRRALAQLAQAQAYALIPYPGESSPYLCVSGTWDGLLASKTKKFRYKVRRREKDLIGTGDFELRWFEGPRDTAPLLADILRIEAGSWKVAEAMDIPSRPMELRYHERLLPMLARDDLLLANVLYIRGEPAAYNLCSRWDGRIGHLKTSFQQRFAEVSPGAMAFEATLRRAFQDGCREFDFLGDEMGHKLFWSTGTRAHESLLLCSRSLEGRGIGLLKRAIHGVRRWQAAWGRHRGAAATAATAPGANSGAPGGEAP